MKPTENLMAQKCALCDYSTTLRKQFKRHLTTHLIEKPFKCAEWAFKAKRKDHVAQHAKKTHILQLTSLRPVPCGESGCNYAARQKQSLTKHSKIHCPRQLKFVCSHPNCKYATNAKGNLVRHFRIHTGEKPWVCPFESCSYITARSHNLFSHSRTHTKEKPYKCPEPNCEYAAAQNVTLKQHQFLHEPEQGEQLVSFKCPICEYSTKINSGLTAHIKSHKLEKHFKCDEPNCTFEAKRKEEVDRHQVVHSDEKPLACSVESCDFRCKLKQSLSEHLKTHSEERRYKCELCPFRAKKRNVVSKHLRFVHVDPNFRPFKCTEPKCDYASKTKPVLNQHLLTHGGEKTYGCSFPNCVYAAARADMIKKHQQRHETGKKFKCESCGFATNRKATLMSHLKSQ